MLHRTTTRSRRLRPLIFGLLSLGILASAAFATSTGILAQLAGTAACVTADGSGGACATAATLDGTYSAAVSPDGRHVYAAALNSNAVTVFARDGRTGALTQLAGTAGCVSEDGTGGACADGIGLGLVNDIAVSPDGRNVYVTSTDGGLALFARDGNTGAITQFPGTAGCINFLGSPGGLCTVSNEILNPQSLAVSRDGKNVYVTSTNAPSGLGSIVVLARDGKTGGLTQLAGAAGCVTPDGAGGDCTVGTPVQGQPVRVVVSQNGKNVYVTAAGVQGNGLGGVSVFARDRKTGALAPLAGTAGCVSEDGTGGACADGIALDKPVGLAVSRDGKTVYVTSGNGSGSNAVSIFSRDGKTGALTQLAGTAGCVSEDGTGGACADGVALNNPLSLIVSRDGKHVYVASFYSNAVTVFARDGKTGALTQLAGAAGCVSDDGTGGACAGGIALSSPTRTIMSPNGKNLYVPSFGASGIAVFARS